MWMMLDCQSCGAVLEKCMIIPARHATVYSHSRLLQQSTIGPLGMLMKQRTTVDVLVKIIQD